MKRRIYKKPHRARRKKPVYAKPLFWKSLVLFSLSAGTFWLVCFSPVLEIKEIEVSGAQKINDQECVEAIETQTNKKIALFDSKSILLFDIDQVKKDLLARFPQAENITIEREFPSKIIASVQERRGVALLDNNDRKYLLDNEGIAFEKCEEPGNLIEIAGSQEEVVIGQVAVEKALLSAILRMKSDIVSSTGIDIVSAIIATPERINLLTREGWYIYFNPLKDSSDQSLKLLAVTKDEIFEQKKDNLEYIDVRFTRVYLKEKQTGESVSIDNAKQAATEENQDQ